MENRKLIYLFGMLFSIVFAAFYFFIFSNYITNDTSKTMYFNQVGLYKDEANSIKMIDTLKESEITAYSVKKDEVTAVVCGLSEELTQTQKQQEILTSLGLTFIEKQVKIEDSNILSLLESKDFAKALELMKY